MFSHHFVRRWAERKGGFPSIEEVNSIIASSLRIIKQEVLFRRTSGGKLVRRRQLSHFWHHASGVILLVDEDNGIAVTVITPDMPDKYGEGQA
jgi:hypothetical protein